MVAATVHIPQQNFLIASFSKIKFFHWLRQCYQYLGPCMISPYEILPYIPLTHIYMSCISHFCGRIFKHTILEVVYDGKGTQKQNTFPSFRNCVTTQSVSQHSFPNLHHIQLTENISGICLTSSKRIW